MRQKGSSRRILPLLAAHFGIALFATNADAQSGNSIQWSVTPYIWASDTSLDLSLRDSSIVGVDISFSDLVDMLDTAFQVQVEGGKGNWSGFADLTYLSLSDSEQRPIVRIDSESKQLFLDAAVAYWPGGFASPLNFFGGVRYSGFDDRYLFTFGGSTGETRSTRDYVDALLGVRYRFDLSPRWALLTHGDVSFGSSEGTWLLQGMFAYTVGKRQRNRILLGYRYKRAEFKDGDLTTDFTYGGPLAGFDFRF